MAVKENVQRGNIMKNTDFFGRDKLLQCLVHVMYGIPPQRILRCSSARWHWSALSLMLVLLQWAAFGVEMYVAKTYWSGAPGTIQIPTEALLLIISLVLSGAFSSYTLFVVYFYHPKHQFQCNGKQRFIAYFDFTLQGNPPQEMSISPRVWCCVNVLVILGICGIALVAYCAVGLNLFFDFYGLHDFTAAINTSEKIIYYFAIFIINWGYVSDIVACCVFHVICKDMMLHIEETEGLIIENITEFCAARKAHECLLSYIGKVMKTIKPWFIIHSIFFIFIMLTTVVEVVVALTELKGDLFSALLSQTAGSLLIAFKYAFPIISASRVTSCFDNMYNTVNRKCDSETFPEINIFMSYCRRCKPGFIIFGIKVTAQLALIAVLSCFVGFFQLFRAIKTLHV